MTYKQRNSGYKYLAYENKPTIKPRSVMYIFVLCLSEVSGSVLFQGAPKDHYRINNYTSLLIL
jgi:hypothetical protein